MIYNFWRDLNTGVKMCQKWITKNKKRSKVENLQFKIRTVEFYELIFGEHIEHIFKFLLWFSCDTTFNTFEPLKSLHSLYLWFIIYNFLKNLIIKMYLNEKIWKLQKRSLFTTTTHYQSRIRTAAILWIIICEHYEYILKYILMEMLLNFKHFQIIEIPNFFVIMQIQEFKLTTKTHKRCNKSSRTTSLSIQPFKTPPPTRHVRFSAFRCLMHTLSNHPPVWHRRNHSKFMFYAPKWKVFLPSLSTRDVCLGKCGYGIRVGLAYLAMGCQIIC